MCMDCDVDERREELEKAEGRLEELEEMFDTLDRLFMAAPEFNQPWETIAAAKLIMDRYRIGGKADGQVR